MRGMSFTKRRAPKGSLALGVSLLSPPAGIEILKIPNACQREHVPADFGLIKRIKKPIWVSGLVNSCMAVIGDFQSCYISV